VIDFQRLLSVLTDGGVEFIVIGGLAATIHGSAHSTLDLDVVYRRTPENIARLAAALAPLSPYLRGAPPGLPFHFDAATIRRGLNFTLTTAVGPFDALGEVTGGGGYDALLPGTVTRSIFGIEIRFVDLDTLIRLKRAAGRPKDLERIAELEAIVEEKRRT
jgi:hypothetical protein